MITHVDIPNALTTVEVFAPLARTANANSGNGIDTKDYIGKMAFVLHSSEDTTDEDDSTMQVYLLESDEVNANFVNANITFTNVANTAPSAPETVTIDTRERKRYVQAAVHMSGSNTPSWTFGVTATGVKQVD